jgi:hypothetical protein
MGNHRPGREDTPISAYEFVRKEVHSEGKSYQPRKACGRLNFTHRAKSIGERGRKPNAPN